MQTGRDQSEVEHRLDQRPRAAADTHGSQLTVEARDFGPIISAQVCLRPLTILIGPNNSGKSYAAVLCRALLRPPRHAPARAGAFWGHEAPGQDEAVSAIVGRIAGALRRGEEYTLTADEGTQLLATVLHGAYPRRLEAELERSFGSPLADLRRIGKASFSLGLTGRRWGTRLAWRRGSLTVSEHRPLGVDIRFRAAPVAAPGYSLVQGDRHLTVALDAALVAPEQAAALGLALARATQDIVAGVPEDALPRECHYLPAARSGLLEAHKVLVASILRELPYAGTRDLAIPRMSGVVSDFIASMIDLPRDETALYNLTRGYEERLVSGEITLPIPEVPNGTYPEILYGFAGTQIPLHRASSTVSELAPLFLYLKYLVNPGDVLIIEEPEAHLHPANQRLLAELLVQLVRHGLSLLLTTHSEFLLEQLSTFVRLGAVSPAERKTVYGRGADEYLQADEVSVHTFAMDRRGRGHTTTAVPVTAEDGIPQDEFVRVHEVMYEESYRIHLGAGDDR